MRVDISLDPKATHYCKWCGLTMKARDEMMCRCRDGDPCEPKKRAPKGQRPASVWAAVDKRYHSTLLYVDREDAESEHHRAPHEIDLVEYVTADELAALRKVAEAIEAARDLGMTTLIGMPDTGVIVMPAAEHGALRRVAKAAREAVSCLRLGRLRALRSALADLDALSTNPKDGEP